MYSLEPLLVQKLKDAAIADVTDVVTLADISLLADTTKRPPCLFVINRGLRPYVGAGQLVAQSKAQQIDTLWWVVLCVKNTAQPDSGQPAREVAQAIMTNVREALQGEKLSPQHGPLTIYESPAPSYTDGLAWFALGFSCRQTFIL